MTDPLAAAGRGGLCPRAAALRRGGRPRRRAAPGRAPRRRARHGGIARPFSAPPQPPGLGWRWGAPPLRRAWRRLCRQTRGGHGGRGGGRRTPPTGMEVVPAARAQDWCHCRRRRWRRGRPGVTTAGTAPGSLGDLKRHKGGARRLMGKVAPLVERHGMNGGARGRKSLTMGATLGRLPMACPSRQRKHGGHTCHESERRIFEWGGGEGGWRWSCARRQREDGWGRRRSASDASLGTSDCFFFCPFSCSLCGRLVRWLHIDQSTPPSQRQV